MQSASTFESFFKFQIWIPNLPDAQNIFINTWPNPLDTQEYPTEYPGVFFRYLNYIFRGPAYYKLKGWNKAKLVLKCSQLQILYLGLKG